ncbi:MAG: 2Fe-2S iron-sulfur cluster binding domain-containing protein [Deltaproteobacteria bacterium]|jgi:glycine betaine catabolism B|nr:2Fe-2S iron-sulfur cluster binding domain-containing protein [Deltaproteobacteria bacterium]MBT4637827.1 2Fe-2S iron-sulfur cluster binding domain-containing protein [Deltaproteobacteria bacterium]MBT6499335.1 2Fe-2S iron-sulfur cluster binding domain-containing protein [Deltaproteobacteria bacterium]MBT6613513.1 2Fe-2S iron-sulfur cluster binding domain-containing protein [Deltaproteobacteria bacterium]MBT7150820.1 2Fe-2S iron-sulfur cluster binding domain-containing protein [Deltaproteobac
MRNDNKVDIEGYTDIQQEIEILQKYSLGRTSEKGQVSQIIDRLHPKTLQLQVSRVLKETESTITLRLVAEEGYLPPFQAGQYINLFTEVNGVRTSRPYSISSPPHQTGYYDITIRQVADGFVSKHFITRIKPGTRLESSSPAGQFYHNPLFHGDDLIFLAGGSGITPFMSMIREVTDRGIDRRMHLIYGCRTEDDVVFEKELQERAATFSNFKLSLVISEPTIGFNGPSGFITADLIRKRIGDLENRMFYVCGPEAMYSFVLDELQRAEIPNRLIRREVFGPPADITTQAGWPESVKKEDTFSMTFNNSQPIETRANEPLMNSLERAGLILPAQCRSGECSLCRTRLVSGRVFQPRGVKLRKSDQKFGYIHPCMAYPLEDLELML